jgi:hypothetical protein
LLLDAAALLTASLTLNGVSEAFGVHDLQGTVLSQRLPTSVAGPTVDVVSGSLWLNLSARLGTSVPVGVAGEPGVSAQPSLAVHVPADLNVKSVSRLTGASLLAGLSGLSVGDISAFVMEFPGQVDSLLAVPPAASEVAGWWSGLGGTERSSLLAAAPRLVGNLEGIPFRERGRANARYLDQSLTEVTQSLSKTADGGRREALTREHAVLTQVKAALRAGNDGPRRSLILLDTVAGGRAAIALGNPDTADYVSYLVPGMNYGVEPQIVNWTATAGAVYAEQSTVLTERADAGQGPRDASVATIAWIGYEAPDLFSVGGLDRAEVGADFLEKSSLGIQADRGSRQPFISVFAHSYGSTVALTALSRGSFTVDALVLVGSPGSQIQSVSSLSVAHGNVYVGKADWDPAVNSAFFGSDPGAASYGARTLGVTGARDKITGRWLNASVGHNAYFDVGSESLHNMALIGTDLAELVTDGSE